MTRKRAWMVAFLLVLIATLPAWAQNAKSIAVLISTRGEVEVAQGQNPWGAAKFGVVLDDGDRLRTGTDGFASIVFTDDKSQIKIRPNTTITVNATRDPDFSLAKRVNMDVGQLFADVQQQKGTMRVATPNSVASVKGTQFWVLVSGTGQSQLLTLQGVVEMLSLLSGQSVNVGAGNSATVLEGGEITTGTITPEDIPDLGELGPTRVIEIHFTGEDGTQKTLKIEIQVPEEGQ
ncbi:MAG: FecR family protein [bacterium]